MTSLATSCWHLREKLPKTPYPMTVSQILMNGLSNDHQIFINLSGTISLTNLPDMGLPVGCKMQFIYCIVVRKTSPASKESNESEFGYGLTQDHHQWHAEFLQRFSSRVISPGPTNWWVDCSGTTWSIWLSFEVDHLFVCLTPMWIMLRRPHMENLTIPVTSLSFTGCFTSHQQLKVISVSRQQELKCYCHVYSLNPCGHLMGTSAFTITIE